jgi:hypothetical protein
MREIDRHRDVTVLVDVADPYVTGLQMPFGAGDLHTWGTGHQCLSIGRGRAT